jgi:hypothetical protein
VETGLREWFVILAYRGEDPLMVPSRAVDEAWRLFSDDPGYAAFCEEVLGELVERGSGQFSIYPIGDSALDTVRVWERTKRSRKGRRPSVIWELDERVGMPDPVGISDNDLLAMNARNAGSTGNQWMYGAGSM